MSTIAYTAQGSNLFVNGFRMNQVQSALWDHTTGRLRVRLIYFGDETLGQELLRGLRIGAFVDLRFEIPDKKARECKAVVRFCRTRLSLNHVIRTTAEFILDEEQFSRVITQEKRA